MANEVITLPLPTGFNYDFVVDWGDGTTSEVDSPTDIDIAHTYAVAGNYTVEITGLCESWSFSSFPTDKDKITAVTDLGDVGWKDFSGAFENCQNLTNFDGGVTDEVTNMSSMFNDAINVTPDASTWDTGLVTNMNSMFRDAAMANPVTTTWDTSLVTNMTNMFYGASLANPCLLYTSDAADE